MIIRWAVPSDEPAIAAIARAAYAPFVPLIGRAPAPMVADFASGIASGRLRVAEDRELLGYSHSYPTGTAWHLENIAVSPEAQGIGVGRRLIDDVEALAAGAGAEAVELYTNVMMVRNLEMYPRLGFAEVGRRTEDGFDRVYYRKDLGTI